jgi:hypothetical protein
MAFSTTKETDTYSATGPADTHVSPIGGLSCVQVVSRQWMPVIAMRFSLAWRAPFLAAINHIVLLGTIANMLWIKTRRGITRMPDMILFVYRNTMPDNHSKTMDTIIFFVIAHNAIPMIIDCACPQPTAGHWINAAPAE